MARFLQLYVERLGQRFVKIPSQTERPVKVDMPSVNLVEFGKQKKKSYHVVAARNQLYEHTPEKPELSLLQGESPLAVRHCLPKNGHMFCFCSVGVERTSSHFEEAAVKITKFLVVVVMQELPWNLIGLWERFPHFPLRLT